MAVKRDYGSFARFKSRSDIADVYLARTSQTDAAQVGWRQQLAALNQGLLLLEAGRHIAARAWLEAAGRLMNLPVYYTADGEVVQERRKGVRLVRPGANDLHALSVTRAALAQFDP